ncbi:TrkH family potassium uptake protein [Mycoplasma bradburyae]|uniref:Cation transporter n=1 Tax=Mycoplasma bradburyae TaxID=2963128 RepID=A0AAW6HQ80_9MOLU|nr:potassium transporter TrkG [Mycoplasma bradburyae]MDC4182830.1 cation transporter [Mycoplasma bradburyae]MDC4183504.1 cation transporter [Mycoplasma bradburyae]MDC4184243.1 cation transporter [Mycoplasma bradburyae]UTS70600.1 cation transporter [Mycoplasma bradburyae]
MLKKRGKNNNLLLNRKQKIYKLLKIIFIGETISQKIAHFYIYFILIGSILLYIPISLKYSDTYEKVTSLTYQGLNAEALIEKEKYSFIDAFFIATSAFSDTGLSTLVVRETFTIFGQVILAILIEVGGVGFVVFWYLIWKVFAKIFKDHSTLEKTLLLQSERGGEKISTTSKTIIVSVIAVMIFQILYSIFYALYFYFVPAYEQQNILNLQITNVDSTLINFKASQITVDNKFQKFFTYHNPGAAIWAGIFHSVSSINNAGFDIFGPFSLSSFKNDYHILLLFITATQFFIGGIGYPTIFDIYEKIRYKRLYKNTIKYKFSIFTKLSLITSAILLTLPIIIVAPVELLAKNGSFRVTSQFFEESLKGNLTFESSLNINTENDLYHTIYGKNPQLNYLLNLWFMIFSTRSAGFATISMYNLTDASKLLLSILMFIGAAPSSTAGGIRTTTFALVIVAIFQKFKGYKQVRLFKRSIPSETVNNAYLITILSTAFITIAILGTHITFILVKPDVRFSIMDVLFEYSSGYGTVGLSVGITSYLTSITLVPLVLLIALMIIGQLGVTTSILAWVKSNVTKSNYSYVDEDVKIG